MIRSAASHPAPPPHDRHLALMFVRRLAKPLTGAMTEAQRDLGRQSKPEHFFESHKTLPFYEQRGHESSRHSFGTCGKEPSRRERLLCLDEPSGWRALAAAGLDEIADPFTG